MILDFHIGEGGLLHRLETAAHLTSLRRQILTALSITWVPLVAVGLVTELLTGRVEPIIHDLSAHVRLLVAMPVFLFLDRVFPLACRSSLEQLYFQGFVPAAEEPRFERLLQSAARLTRTMLPELLMVLLGFALGIAALLRMVPIGGLTRSDPMTASQVWYALVDWPFFQFLLWRSLWRWLVWVRVLAGVSRLDLAFIPTHPDRRGGIKFLSEPSVNYCATVLFAVSSVVCADWGRKLTFATVQSFEPVLLAFTAVAILVAFGPLLVFYLPLLRARRIGLLETAGVAAALGRRLRTEWLEHLEQPEQRGLESRPRIDPEPLAQMSEIYTKTAQRFVLVLFDVRDLISLLIATLLPVLPVMLAHIPAEDWRMLLTLLTGGRVQ